MFYYYIYNLLKRNGCRGDDNIIVSNYTFGRVRITILKMLSFKTKTFHASDPNLK